jgi:hypothetical protein
VTKNKAFAAPTSGTDARFDALASAIAADLDGDMSFTSGNRGGNLFAMTGVDEIGDEHDEAVTAWKRRGQPRDDAGDPRGTGGGAGEGPHLPAPEPPEALDCVLLLMGNPPPPPNALK